MKTKNKSRFVIGFFAIVMIIAATLYYSKQAKLPSPLPGAADQTMAQKPPLKIWFSAKAEEQGRSNIRNSPRTSKLQKAAMTQFESLMKDAAFASFFNMSLDFFGPGPGAYPAARFVALTMRFDGSTENFYLMSWTKRELLKYSSELMTTLEQKKELIDVNPYFHSRMLNLAHNLNVPPERKVAFFANTLSQAPQVNDSGNLKDESLAFETALILTKQNSAPTNEIITSIASAIQRSKTVSQKTAIHERVAAYYPELDFLFQ